MKSQLFTGALLLTLSALAHAGACTEEQVTKYVSARQDRKVEECVRLGYGRDPKTLSMPVLHSLIAMEDSSLTYHLRFNQGITLFDPSRLSLLEKMLESGLEVDARDDKGRTPLMFVAEIIGMLGGESLYTLSMPDRRKDIASYTPILELLIKHGADLNLTDTKGRVALQVYQGFCQSSLTLTKCDPLIEDLLGLNTY